jgi:SAM-dependent methyltransferase
MHAIPLAQRGFDVIAIDNCHTLLDELRGKCEELSVEIVEDDLLLFPSHLPKKADLMLCMTDTITHLTDKEAIIELIRSVFDHLNPGGRFVTTFRDYSKELVAEQRFIPVRSSPERVFSCFLEYGDSHLTVNDILYQWNGNKWDFSVSSYQKTRISPEWLLQELEEIGFEVVREVTPSGMIRVIADRA